VRLSPEEIYDVALRAGFTPDQAVTFTAIALAESRGDPSANAAGSEDSRGLWQINVSPGVHVNRWGNLYDPQVNARAAYEVSGGGTNIRPWSVTHAKHAGTAQDYRTYLPQAEAAAAAAGSGGMDATLSAVATETPVGTRSGAGVDTFVQAALNQEGDSYVFGHETDLDDIDPATFDCSELVQWAAAQAGVEVVDGSWNQYLTLQDKGGEISVDEALRTPGALLFSFSSTPTSGGGRPRSAHVAISLGDGRTIEAGNPRDGVEIETAGDRFNHAAVIPELAGSVTPFAMQLEFLPPPPADTDQDGLTDYFEELLGTDAAVADTDADSLTDLYETTVSHTNPLAGDTDADGSGDSREVAEGTEAGEVELSEEVVDAGFAGAETADADDDDLSDAIENEFGSDRTVADTDRDGVRDNIEYTYGSDPTSIDSDLDGMTDVAERDAGTLGPPRTPLPDLLGIGPPVGAQDPSVGDALDPPPT